MACEGCPNHNFSSGRIPTGNDDPCNTSGEGIFCPGSYWLYDNTISADTDLYGDCPRLFQRIGDTCAVNEWLEIPIATIRRETVDPGVDDCCPPGTLWVNETDDTVFISTADLDVNPIVCSWCQICGPDPIPFYDTDTIFGALTALPDPIPAATVDALVAPDQFITVNNTTNNDLICMFVISDPSMNTVNNGPNGVLRDIRSSWLGSDDGGATWVGFGIASAADINIESDINSEFHEISGSGTSISRILAPGASLTFGLRRQYSSNSGWDGPVFIDDQQVRMTCIGLNT